MTDKFKFEFVMKISSRCILTFMPRRKNVKISLQFYLNFDRKDSTVLGEQWKKGIPIEVVPMAYCPVKLKIENELGGQAVLRQAKAKAVS